MPFSLASFFELLSPQRSWNEYDLRHISVMVLWSSSYWGLSHPASARYPHFRYRSRKHISLWVSCSNPLRHHILSLIDWFSSPHIVLHFASLAFEGAGYSIPDLWRLNTPLYTGALVQWLASQCYDISTWIYHQCWHTRRYWCNWVSLLYSPPY